MRLKVKSSVAEALTYLGYTDGNGDSTQPATARRSRPSPNGRRRPGTLPGAHAFPISISASRAINDDRRQTEGRDDDVGSVRSRHRRLRRRCPPEAAPQPEPLISDTATCPAAGRTSTSRRSPTSSSPPKTRRSPKSAPHGDPADPQTDPDLIVLNGDVTDRGLPQDMALAREVLEEAGCEIIPPTETEPADNTPAPGAEKVPCYYVPGNHESYGLNNVQDDPGEFEAQFGTPYRNFDHKGTRFVLLASVARAPCAAPPGSSCRCSSEALDEAEDGPVDQQRDGLRPPPGRRSVADQGEPARRPRRGDADREDADRLPRRKSARRRRWSAPTRRCQRPPIEGIPYVGAALLGQGPVRDAGPRWLHRLGRLVDRPGKDAATSSG